MDELLLQMIGQAPTMIGLLLLWFEQRSMNDKLFRLVMTVLDLDEQQARALIKE